MIKFLCFFIGISARTEQPSSFITFFEVPVCREDQLLDIGSRGHGGE
jgi:hypothetical protein